MTVRRCVPFSKCDKTAVASLPESATCLLTVGGDAHSIQTGKDPLNANSWQVKQKALPRHFSCWDGVYSSSEG